MNTPIAVTPPVPDQLPGEPRRWYSRCLQFVLAGTGRSVEACWREELANTSPAGAQGSQGRRAPGAWWRNAAAWRWEERASQWDAAVFAAEAQAVVQERADERTRRRALVRTFLTRAEELAADATLLRAAPAAASAFLLRALAAHKAEYGRELLPEEEKRLDDTLPLAGVAGTVGAVITILGGNDLPDDEVVELPDTTVTDDVRLRLVGHGQPGRP